MAVRSELTNAIANIPAQTNPVYVAQSGTAQVARVADTALAGWPAPVPQTNVTHNSLLGIEGAGTLHVSAAETGLVHTAWQNPASASYWTWTKTATEVTLTSYSGPAAVVIPDTLDNLPVTGFGTLFKQTAVTSISGGDNIKTIDTAAFLYCTALTSFGLNNATKIGNSAFYACTALTNIILPNATNVGTAFFNCTALISVSLPNAVTIGTQAFYGCTALTSVYFCQNAPAEAASVYTDSPNATNYVTSTTATGWGATWNGRPVVRLPVYSDLFTGSGAGVSNIPIAGVTGLQGAMDGKLNTNGVTAGIIAAAGGQLAETVVTGAVCTVTSGNRYFFTTATNVTLSASLTGGQVVNYAALRNTATNSITATAESAGWKWTGGSMTNSIPANTMMTFGWACNPFTGATNAYATAASVN
jgi:hypothetical protein